MKKIESILLIVFVLISCQNKDLYPGTTEPTTPTTPTDEDKTTADYSAPYIYPFSDETTNAVAVVTIKAKKDITASSIVPAIPYLKYNKSWLMLFTQDDVKQAIYCRTWAKINGKPFSSSVAYDEKHELYYDYLHLVNGDLPPTVHSATEALGSTDGAGNTVRFAVTATLKPEADWMNAAVVVSKDKTDNYYRFYMKSGLTWYDVMDMLNYGTGLAFHNVNANDEQDATQVLQHFIISQNSIQKHLSGRGCKMLAEPDGNKVYVKAALQYPSIQTMTAQTGTTVLYPFKVTNDLKDVLANRVFYTVDELKNKIQSLMNIEKENREAVCVGVHNTDDTWLDCLQWVNDRYGKKGDDSVWFPNLEEYYEYNYYRIHGTSKVEQVDNNTIKLTISLPSGAYFYYPSVTVNLQGLVAADVSSISVNDVVTGLSYADYNNTLMLNVDCRKHLDDMATHYVELYEKDKTSTLHKSDATYFTNMLKAGTLKDALLKRLAQ